VSEPKHIRDIMGEVGDKIASWAAKGAATQALQALIDDSSDQGVRRATQLIAGVDPRDLDKLLIAVDQLSAIVDRQRGKRARP
jgi:hypothetical protein